MALVKDLRTFSCLMLSVTTIRTGCFRSLRAPKALGLTSWKGGDRFDSTKSRTRASVPPSPSPSPSPASASAAKSRTMCSE